MINLKKKIELSNILEKIEVDGDSLENIKLLDKFHSKPRSHVLGITGPPGAGKSSLIDKLITIIRKKNKSIKLVFTGPGTEILNGIYLNNQLQLQKKNQSIYGLGHIENDEIDYLIKKAKIVINCSLYEPGNGSGLDAWKIGTPVAMSNIPAFKEHIKYLGVIAQIFDPLDASDISKKLNKILKYKKNVKEKIIKISRERMKKISWDLIIKQYINFIKQ